jgi:single-stranded-DNA-specific exonuclease
MRYQLLHPVNSSYSAIEQVLTNRGIPHDIIEHYLNTTDEDINSPLAFGEENLKAAARMLIQCIGENRLALIVVDSDCDGFTSSALLINFLHDLFPTWVENKLSYFIHEGKQHGLSDCFHLASDYDLVILPDSSSNDYEYHKMLVNEWCTGVIVLDHHEAEKISPQAIIINNQLSDYPNKELSGVGVTWQFCRYLDSLLKTNYADKYLDLVALGNMADMMSLKSIETKHLILKGLEDKNILNPFIFEMAQKNKFSLGDKITPMGAAFYIAPFVNAMVRSGTKEEKELLFKSMIKHEAFKMIPSTKRGHKLGEEERVVDQSIRTCTNVKNRQTRAQDAGLEFLEHMIEEQDLLRNKVLLFLLEPGQIDRNIAGLIANKFMAKYQRPCCILTKVTESESGNMIPFEDGDIKIKFESTTFKTSYQGSARGYDKSGITNFKDICAEAPGVLFAEGHQGAFGLGIEAGLVNEFIEYTNDALKDMSSEPIYYVDYIYNGEEVNPQNILDIANLEDLWGKDMDESLIAIENLKVTKDMVVLMSPDKKPTLKITLPNKVSLIKFNSNQEEYEKLLSEGYIQINVIGKCNKNVWNGYTTPQIFIEDYEIVSMAKYIF